MPCLCCHWSERSNATIAQASQDRNVAGLEPVTVVGRRIQVMHSFTSLSMPSPSGPELKAARLAAGLSQVQAAELMGYPVQAGSRGGMQSRTWQALESEQDPRNMPGPIFAMFLLLTQQHPLYVLADKVQELQ